MDESQVVATDEPSPDQAPKPPIDDKVRLEQQQQRLLSELPGPPEAVWIEVDGEKVLGFWSQDQSNKPVGAVVLLHAQGQNPRWNDTLLRLHHHLPLHGWAAFSIELPELPEPQVPERKANPPANADSSQAAPSKPADETNVVHQEPEANTAAPSPAGSTPPANAVSTSDTRATIQERIAAAARYLQKQGQYNLVLLGEGASALWALEHLGQAAAPDKLPKADDPTRKAIVDRPIRALIMLDLRIPESLPLSELKERLRHPEIPTMDIYTDPGIPARYAAEERKQLSIKAGYQTYVLRRLPPAVGIPAAEEETNLVKALRGFLQQHARGEQLDQGLGGGSSDGGSSAGI